MNKNFSIVILFLVIFQSFSQTIIENKSSDRFIKYSEASELEVVYKYNLNALHSNKKPAVFINGIFIKNESILGTIDMKKIESFEIEKENYENNGIEYHGKILVKMKSKHSLKLITLKELSIKYLKLNANPIIFQIDQNVINANYDEYIINESYILRIIIDKIKIQEKGSEFNLVKLITKTAENITKANEIRIK